MSFLKVKTRREESFRTSADAIILKIVGSEVLPMVGHSGSFHDRTEKPEDLARLTNNLKGGDAGRFGMNILQCFLGAIEDISSITGKDHAGEVTVKAHEFCGGKVFRFLVPAGSH